jgi:hypothetical protein
MRQLREERAANHPASELGYEIPIDESDFVVKDDVCPCHGYAYGLRGLKGWEPASQGHDTYRQHDTGLEVPILNDRWDRPTPAEPIPACRVHVEKPVANYTLPALDCGKELERILLIGDVHAPFHDKYAWDAMMKFARQWRPHTIIQEGDFGDFYSVSDHDKDPRRANNLLEECKATNALFDELDDLKPERKIFDEGNHCWRLERHLMSKSSALLGAVTIDGLFHLQERGWMHVPYMSYGRIGNLHHTHDVGKSGANAVRQTAAAVGHSIAFGHCHRLEQIYFGTVLGERYTAACVGWLGDVAAANYVSEVVKAQWQHGFATALMDKGGDFELQLRPIVNYRVISL